MKNFFERNAVRIIVVLMSIQVLLFAYGVFMLINGEELHIGIFNVIINGIFFFVNLNTIKIIKEIEEFERRL